MTFPNRSYGALLLFMTLVAIASVLGMRQFELNISEQRIYWAQVRRASGYCCAGEMQKARAELKRAAGSPCRDWAYEYVSRQVAE